MFPVSCYQVLVFLVGVFLSCYFLLSSDSHLSMVPCFSFTSPCFVWFNSAVSPRCLHSSPITLLLGCFCSYPVHFSLSVMLYVFLLKTYRFCSWVSVAYFHCSRQWCTGGSRHGGHRHASTVASNTSRMGQWATSVKGHFHGGPQAILKWLGLSPEDHCCWFQGDCMGAKDQPFTFLSSRFSSLPLCSLSPCSGGFRCCPELTGVRTNVGAEVLVVQLEHFRQECPLMEVRQAMLDLGGMQTLVD